MADNDDTSDEAAGRGVGELLICRHGETTWSREGRHTGTTDVPLTATGEAQARALASLLAARPGPIAHVLVSPRQRARATARLVGFPAAYVTDDLVEWDYGRYEGRTTADIRQERPGWTIWTGNPPGGERAHDVGARADRLLKSISTLLPDGDVLVVGHGHFGRVLAARYLRLPPSGGALLQLDPATLCVLGTEHDTPSIVRWNMPAGPVNQPLA